MKMKRFMSLLLALVMSLSMAVPAFAAEPDDPDEGIMPLAVIYPSGSILDQNDYETRAFSATPGNGKWIRFWFENQTKDNVKVYLLRQQSSGVFEVVSGPVEVPGYNNLPGYYYNSTADSGVYKILIEAYVEGGSVQGRVSAAQYQTKPAG